MKPAHATFRGRLHHVTPSHVIKVPLRHYAIKRSSTQEPQKSALSTSDSSEHIVDETAGLVIEDRNKGPNTKAILDELFPRGSLAHRRPVRNNRPVPKLPLKPVSAASVSAEEKPFPAQAWSHIDGQHAQAPQQESGSALLILYRASKSLNENDFNIVTPGGKHIEGWNRPYRIQKIIRERDLLTMERTGTYILVFSDENAAAEYSRHVKALHTLARSYDPTRLPHRIPLVPADKSAKWDPARKLESYALYPPTANLRLSLEKPPYETIRKQVVELGGYLELMRDKQSEHEVLITLQGYDATAATILEAIRRDERDSGLSWSLVGANSGVRSVYNNRSAEEKQNIAATSHEAQSGQLDPDQPEPGSRFRTRQFIVSFADQAEAQRFMILWHQRDIGYLLDDTLDMSVLVSTDFTW